MQNYSQILRQLYFVVNMQNYSQIQAIKYYNEAKITSNEVTKKSP